MFQKTRAFNEVLWEQKRRVKKLFDGKRRSFIKRQTSGTSSGNERQRMVQPGTMNDNE